jgi:hypothetical protein
VQGGQREWIGGSSWVSMRPVKWAVTSSMPWSAIESALCRAAATVSGVPGHSGATVS